MLQTRLALLLLAVLAPGVQASDYPMLDRLADEAAMLKTERPDRWKRYHEEVEGVFSEHQKLVANWRKRSNPPRPDLKPLTLPLAFLVEALQRGEKLIEGTQLRSNRLGAGPLDRHRSYMDAIVHHQDVRRIRVLLEYRDKLRRRLPDAGQFYPWGRMIADAATREWAVVQIRKLVQQNPKPDLTHLANDLLYCLMDRFARELPADVRKASFDYLRKQFPYGPSNGDAERIWDLLLRLDPERGRKEIIRYFHFDRSAGSGAYNIYVVFLLHKHAGPSDEVADAARKWLSSDRKLAAHSRRLLRVTLLRSDPKGELEPAAKYVDEMIATKENQGFKFLGTDAHYLLGAMMEIDSEGAFAHLARYVPEPAIPEGIRFLILESLAEHRYDKTPQLCARWLAEERPYMKRRLLAAAEENWDDYGRAVLQEAERINARKMQDHQKATSAP